MVTPPRSGSKWTCLSSRMASLPAPTLTGTRGSLQVRERAGRFVAHQARSVLAQGGDPKPVLEALAGLPQWNDERSSRLIAREARDCLRRAGMQSASGNPYEWALRAIESRSELPKFYRRKDVG